MITQMNKRLISLSLSVRNSVQLHRPPLYQSVSLLFYSSSKPKVAVAEYLINQHKFSAEAALKASLTVSHLTKPSETDSVLSFLKESGFSQTQLEEVVKSVPRILRANLGNAIKPKIKIFQDFGFLDSDIADVIASDPWILRRSVSNRLGPNILVLQRILGSNAGVLKVLKLSGRYLAYDLENTLVPNIEFLKSTDIKFQQIGKYILNFPRFLLRKQESIVDSVKRADEMGFDRKSKMFLSAVRVLSSMNLETWELKFRIFQSLGLSDNDILAVFKRNPQVFCKSEKKVKQVTELLLSTGKFDISFLVNYPELLSLSVEHRLKPRIKVIEILDKKNLLAKTPNLTTMCKYSEPKFAEKYVIPYANELMKYY